MAAIVAVLMTGGVYAAPLMPDFSTVPTGWTMDRYLPNSFANVGTFAGRDNVLGIGIDPAQGLNLRPPAYQSSFYNTQGRQHDISGGVGDWISAALYIPREWNNAANGNVRTDMWGVMTDGTSGSNGLNVTGYPIIGFTNYGGAARLRWWEDTGAGGWNDLATPINYDDWNEFKILFTGSSYEYYVNDALVAIDVTVDGSTGFKATIMQAYNFCGDTSLPNAQCSAYRANWSNTQIPEPMTAGLLGAGFLGLVASRRRKSGFVHS
jgi:hypothetical protein